jgi:hypothetical protein
MQRAAKIGSNAAPRGLARLVGEGVAEIEASVMDIFNVRSSAADATLALNAT